MPTYDPNLKTEADYLAAMDERQLACRFGHSFPPLLGSELPPGFDAIPLKYGVLQITEECTICTTKLVYLTRQHGAYDAKERTRTLKYDYPDWWVHVPRDKDGTTIATRGTCRAELFDLRMDAIKRRANSHGNRKVA